MVEANDAEDRTQIAEDFELAQAIAQTDLTLAEAGDKDKNALVCLGNGRDGKPLVRKATKPKAKALEVKKFYVIFHATWSRLLQDILPGGALCGSGCSLKGFACLQDAKDKWAAEGWESDAPFTVLP